MSLTQNVKDLILGLMGGEPADQKQIVDGIEKGSSSIQPNGSVPFTSPQGGINPISSSDLATKAYVDSSIGFGDIKADGSVPFSANESMGGFKLINVADPTNPQDSATKNYVDTHGGSVSNVSASSPLFSSGGSTPNITIQTASSSQAGALSSTDWNTFNNKQPAGSYATGTGTANGTNTGDVTLSAVGSSPNANGASLSGQILNLQPFDSTHPGVVTASGGGTTNFLRADGTWVAPSGGANTALSNLTTTSINQSLISSTDSTFDLGSSTKLWNKLYADTLYGDANVSIDLANRTLNRGGTQLFKWNLTSPSRLEATVPMLFDGSTSGAITMTAADTTTNYTIKFPSAQGAASTVLTNDGAGNLSWASNSTQVLVFTSNPGPAGVPGSPIFDVSFVVTGLLATDTILSVTQKTPGAAGTLALLGWHSQANNAIVGEYVADPGVGSVVMVAVKR